MSTVRVLALTRYGALGASSRLRSLQYLPSLRARNLSVQTSPLFDDTALSGRYQRGHYRLSSALNGFARRIQVLRKRHHFDLLWIEKEALPWWPLWLEALLLSGVPYALDYDDALFHNYDQHRFFWARKLYGERLDGLMKKAALVICGNEYLANRARTAGAAWVEVLPTVVDLNRYPSPIHAKERHANSTPRLVWIGSPSTIPYLTQIEQPLLSLAQRLNFAFHVIGGRFQLPGVNVTSVLWTEDTEVSSITACDVGIMPLPDTPWTRGKCGYKLVQYMACGLPVIASPVGVNADIVRHGRNGYLADSEHDWIAALERLLMQPDLRAEMGQIGRQRVEEQYCLQVTEQRLSELLRRAAE